MVSVGDTSLLTAARSTAAVRSPPAQQGLGDRPKDVEVLDSPDDTPTDSVEDSLQFSPTTADSWDDLEEDTASLVVPFVHLQFVAGPYRTREQRVDAPGCAIGSGCCEADAQSAPRATRTHAPDPQRALRAVRGAAAADIRRTARAPPPPPPPQVAAHAGGPAAGLQPPQWH